MSLQRIVFVVTSSIFMLFHLGGALGHNAATILSTRLLAGIFGSARTNGHSPLFAQCFSRLACSTDECRGRAERHVDRPRARICDVAVRHCAMDGTRYIRPTVICHWHGLTVSRSTRSYRRRLGLSITIRMALFVLDHVHRIRFQCDGIFLPDSRNRKHSNSCTSYISRVALC